MATMMATKDAAMLKKRFAKEAISNPQFRDALREFKNNRLYFEMPSPWQIKIGMFNYFWTTGKITLDGGSTIHERGVQTFIELVRQFARPSTPQTFAISRSYRRQKYEETAKTSADNAFMCPEVSSQQRTDCELPEFDFSSESARTSHDSNKKFVAREPSEYLLAPWDTEPSAEVPSDIAL